MKHPTAIEKRAMDQSANVLALQQMTVDTIRKIMKKRRKGFYIVNNLRRANDFLIGGKNAPPSRLE